MPDDQIRYRTPAEQLQYYKDIIEKRGMIIYGMSGDHSILFCGIAHTQVSCKVYVNSGDFEFDYMIPHTTFRITSDKMGPFFNDDHFIKNRSKFVDICNKIAV